MKELEVRFLITNEKCLNELTEYLSQNYTLCEENYQLDKYFKEKGKEQEGDIPGSYILRIRYENETCIATKKETISKGLWNEKEIHLDETQANFIEEILILGFANVLEIEKNRVSYKNDRLTINIDNVKDLGCFLEAELLGDFTEKDKILFTNKIEEEFSFVSPRVVSEGYVQLMKAKNKRGY